MNVQKQDSLFLEPVGGWFFSRQYMVTSYGYHAYLVTGKVTMTQIHVLIIIHLFINILNDLYQKSFLEVTNKTAKAGFLSTNYKQTNGTVWVCVT